MLLVFYNQILVINLSIKTIPETTIQKYTSASRRLFWLGGGLGFLLAGVYAEAILYLESRWSWLSEWRWLLGDIINRALLTFSLLSLIVALIVPSLLFIILYPELGHAWVRGINSAGFSAQPWEQMSDGAKFWSFLGALFYLVAGVAVIYLLIINGWFG
jgi:hypothetical protein